MKFIRRLLSSLFLPAALATLLAIAALLPAVQTWLAQRLLSQAFGTQLTVGTFSARFGQVEITDLRFQREGAVWTAPQLTAQLPLLSSAWHRRLALHSVVAKDWTLDLSRGPQPDAVAAPGTPAESKGPSGPHAQDSIPQARAAFRGILTQLKLPCDASFDGVDLEGDVVVAVGPRKPPSRLHASIKGGGLAPGRTGTLTIDSAGSSVDPVFQILDLTTHGRLVVTMESPRAFSRIQFTSDCVAKVGAPVQEVSFALDAVIARQSGSETYALTATRGVRTVATFLAEFPDNTQRIAGSWKVDWRDVDQAPFTPERALPSFAVMGAGSFDTDAAVRHAHAAGHLNAVASHWGSFASALNAMGSATLDADFDLTRRDSVLRVERLRVALAAPTPVAEVATQQPFEFDASSGAISVDDGNRDLLQGTLQRFPLVWMPGVGGASITDGVAQGGFSVRANHGSFSLSTGSPLTASHFAIALGGVTELQDLTAALTVRGNYSAQGWSLDLAPFALRSGDRDVISLEAKASQSAGSEQPIGFAGTWKLDLEPLATQTLLSHHRWITARSASGDFSTHVAATTKIEGNVVMVGRASGESITAKVSADLGANHVIVFRLPLTLAKGAAKSDVSLEGSWWPGDSAGNHYALRLRGPQVAFEDLQPVAVTAAALFGGASDTDKNTPVSSLLPPAKVRARAPFWGTSTGQVAVAFDELRIDGQPVHNVRGTIEVDHTSLRLGNGLYVIGDQGLAKMNGSIRFDAVGQITYRLQATAEGGDIDAGPLFGRPPPGEDPVFKGHFTMTTALHGQGASLEELVASTEEEFKLTSKNGIVRLLKVTVSGSNPEPSTPGADALDTVGSAVGSLFGFKHASVTSPEIHLAKNTEAVLEFTYQLAEVLYQDMAITAIRGSDRTIRIIDFGMVTKDEHITGTGEIMDRPGELLFARPLRLDLLFGVRGRFADLLLSTDLLSSRKDALGYTLFAQPVHFSGTLAQLDKSEWHDRLAKAALRKPDVPAKEHAAVPVKK